MFFENTRKNFKWNLVGSDSSSSSNLKEGLNGVVAFTVIG